MAGRSGKQWIQERQLLKELHCVKKKAIRELVSFLLEQVQQSCLPPSRREIYGQAFRATVGFPVTVREHERTGEQKPLASVRGFGPPLCICERLGCPYPPKPDCGFGVPRHWGIRFADVA